MGTNGQLTQVRPQNGHKEADGRRGTIKGLLSNQMEDPGGLGEGLDQGAFALQRTFGEVCRRGLAVTTWEEGTSATWWAESGTL